MPLQRKQRGANAIEFALTLPVFLVVFLGAMDWGWYFFIRSQVVNATVIGCEIASRVHPDDPKTAAKVAEEELDQRYKNLGWSCSSLGSLCDYKITTQELANTRVIDAQKTVYCAGELPYTPLTGYVLVPKNFDVRAEMRMEFQK